jgi:hypothetical protein
LPPQHFTPSSEIDRRELVGRVRRGLTARRGVAETELPLGVVAPAFDGAVVEERARVGEPGGDRYDRSVHADCHRGQRVAHLAGRTSAGVRVAESELPLGVVTPALERLVVEHGARVAASDRDALRRASGAERDRREARAHLGRRLISAIGGVAVSGRSRSPALHGRVVEQRARERIEGRSGDHRSACAEIDRRERVAHLACAVAAIHADSVAQHAFVGASPAVDDPRDGHAAREGIARDDGRRGDERQCGRVGGRNGACVEHRARVCIALRVATVRAGRTLRVVAAARTEAPSDERQEREGRDVT